MLDIDIKPYKGTKEELALRQRILSLKEEMETPYRQKAYYTAKWGRDQYEGMARNRKDDEDLLRLSMSYPIVNQRASILQNNPSTAVFKTINEDKTNNIDIFKQIDAYDKDVARYNSSYFDISLTADIEGSSFFKVYWNEEFDEDGNTIGIPSTKVERVRMNDLWWDQGARVAREMNHYILRKTMTFSKFQRCYYPLDGKGYKNIKFVSPLSREECDQSIWNEDWAEFGRDIRGNYVTIWEFESLNFWDGKKFGPRHVMIANGVIIYDSKKLCIPIPEAMPGMPQQKPMLSVSKIDGIPTGHMVGMGIPVLIRNLNEAYDRMLTSSVVQSQLEGAPPLFVRAGANERLEDYPVFPGTIIPVKGTGRSIQEDYQYLQAPGISQGAIKMMADIIENVIMVTGVDIRALFVPGSEKAITTENKRQIQEKLLRFSVQWNEENGFRDLMEMRARLIQKHYPEKRTFLHEDMGPVEGGLKVPVNDYVVEQAGKRIRMNFKKGAYTQIEIEPEMLRMNIDFTIEGALSKEERDVIKRQNFIENLQLIMSMPIFQEALAKNSEKLLQYLLKQANIPEDEIMQITPGAAQQQHPALKEIAACQEWKVLGIQGIKVPDIFEEIPEDENYNPKEYVDIFEEKERSESYKEFDAKARRFFQDRLKLHRDRLYNPYWDVLKEKADKEKMEAEEAGPEGGQPPPPQPQQGGQEDQTMSQVRAEAGQLAQATQ